jgi:G3E family GTPase
MPALPVTVVTGFLGAGKTTMIKQLLSQPGCPRVGLILNEIGPTGIDAVPGTSGLLELPEGCVCCVRSEDLESALAALAARDDVEHVILETTGLADPLPLTWILTRPELAALARLDGVVAVVDALNLDRAGVDEWSAQVSCADLVVLTKLDLADAAAREAARRRVLHENPKARLLAADEVRPSILLGVEADHSGPRPPGHARHSDFASYSLCERGAHDLLALEDFLDELPPEVYRAKGIVELTDGRWATFHAVGGRVQLDDDAAPPAHGESRFLFSGRQLGKAELARRLAAIRVRISPP